MVKAEMIGKILEVTDEYSKTALGKMKVDEVEEIYGGLFNAKEVTAEDMQTGEVEGTEEEIMEVVDLDKEDDRPTAERVITLPIFIGHVVFTQPDIKEVEIEVVGEGVAYVHNSEGRKTPVKTLYKGDKFRTTDRSTFLMSGSKPTVKFTYFF